MKKIFIIMAGLLLIGTSAFAQGDLQVNGSLGVGTAPSAKKIDVLGDMRMQQTTSSGGATTRALDITAVGDGTFAGASVIGINGIAKTLPSTTSDATGFQMQAQHETDVNTLHLKGGYFLVQYRSDATTTINESLALHILHSKSNISSGATTVTDGYGLLSEVWDEASTGSLTFGSFSHINLRNPDSAITVTNDLTGLWIDKQTEGSTNYGIVLNGDGAGADIVLGTGQDTSIYASGGEIFVKDGLSNVTQISPHDPETGEWIYYSKNSKTGVVKRVNMEKLVKAVEKLTGETFMVETMDETK